MATVHVRESGAAYDGQAAGAYLGQQGIPYEFWEADRLGSDLRAPNTPSPDDRKKILDLYAPEISRLKAEKGYVAEDIVSVSAATPNLEPLLNQFRKEHHHTDDEVRYVVDGSGVFTIRKGRLIFDVTVSAGDLLVVPAYTRHAFDLTPARQITCIRVFKDTTGWAAVYEEIPPAG